MPPYCLSLPASAILAEHTFALLRQEGAEGDLIESTRLRQAVGLLVPTQGCFGLRAKRTIRDAGVKAQGFELALRLTQNVSTWGT
jgi:hypothetical protein